MFLRTVWSSSSDPRCCQTRMRAASGHPLPDGVVAGPVFGAAAGVVQVDHPPVGLDRADEIIAEEFLQSRHGSERDLLEWHQPGSADERHRRGVVSPEVDPEAPGLKLAESDAPRSGFFHGQAPEARSHGPVS